MVSMVVKNQTPALYECRLHHVRTQPKRHAFSYRTYQWLVDLEHLPNLPWPLRALARFDARDHLGDPRRSIRANVDNFLATHSIDLEGGHIIMLAHARMLGYVFNPLSVYWCHTPDGALRCVIAEVHNTYGERHCYLLTTDTGGRAQTPKEFYVSPFFEVHGEYEMTLPIPNETLALSIVLTYGDTRPFVATLRGTRQPANAAGVLRAVARHGWSTALVSLRIRWQGVQLWLRGLPVAKRPIHQPQESVQ